MNLTVEQILVYILPLVTGVIAWFGKGRIKHALNIQKEEKTQEAISLENLQKKLDIYQEMLKDVPHQYKSQMADLEANFNSTLDRLTSEIDAIKTLNKELEGIIQDKQEIIEKQDQIIARCRADISRYEDKYGPL